MSVDGSTESGHGFSYSTIASADVTTGWDQAADDTLGFAVAVREGSATPIPLVQYTVPGLSVTNP
jgi:hypothetical protein